MTENAVTIPSNVRVNSSERLTTKNAWAAYVRRRWSGVGAIKAIAAEFGLTEWEARTLYEATSSLATQDKALDSPNGGFALGLTILQIRTQTAITTFIDERRRHEREEYERIDRGLRQMAADLPAVLGVAPPGDC